jgi:hypothetical protein
LVVADGQVGVTLTGIAPPGGLAPKKSMFEFELRQAKPGEEEAMK